MLVAVGLVVLMMSLFAQIFFFATQSMSAQKGTAENDQRVRQVMTVLRNDLTYRKSQEVAPFLPNSNDPLATNAIKADLREGYFYIAENDPDDDTDDILQLVVQMPSGEEFYGAARVILPQVGTGQFGPNASPALPNYPNPSGTLPTTGQAQPANAGNYWPNQPEFDDGVLGLPNGAGMSRTAEVSYFLRKGTLYRRVLMIREVPKQATPPDNPQPKDLAGTDLAAEFYGPTASIPRNFYSYFDYSAYFDGTTAKFHGVNTTNPTMSNLYGISANSIGKPTFRFGHNFANGLPREHIINAGVATYIGRFTHEETSFMDPTAGAIQYFGFPGKVGAAYNAPNPYDDTGTGPALTVDPDTGKVNQYAGGARIGEDVLMTNVMRFDIKVWDDAAGLGPDGQPGRAVDDPTTIGLLDHDDDQDGTFNNATEIGWPGSDDGAFVNLGHNGFIYGGVDVSFYSATVGKLQNNFYCPVNPNKAGSRFYRYDTWNPDVNADGSPPLDFAPFRAPDIPAIGVNPAQYRPLKAIQITITFFDQQTQQLRDVTLVQSLQ